MSAYYKVPLVVRQVYMTFHVYFHTPFNFAPDLHRHQIASTWMKCVILSDRCVGGQACLL